MLSSQKYFQIPKTRKIIRGNATGIRKSRSHHRRNFEILIGSSIYSTFQLFRLQCYAIKQLNFSTLILRLILWRGRLVCIRRVISHFAAWYTRRANAVSELRFKYSFYWTLSIWSLWWTWNSFKITRTGTRIKTRWYPVSRWLYSSQEVYRSDSDSPLEERIVTYSLYPR